MDLDSLRAEIDGIDDKLLALFLRRMRISGEVARYKQSQGLQVLHRDREEQILERMAEKSGPEMAPYTREFYEALLAVSRKLQEGYLGK